MKDETKKEWHLPKLIVVDQEEVESGTHHDFNEQSVPII